MDNTIGMVVSVVNETQTTQPFVVPLKRCNNCLDIFRGKEDIKIGCPLLGCGLASGDWRVVSKIIEEELCDKGWKVIVYVLTEAELNKTLEELHN